MKFLAILSPIIVFIACVCTVQMSYGSNTEYLRCRVMNSWNELALQDVQISFAEYKTTSDSLGFFLIPMTRAEGIVHCTKKGFYSMMVKLDTLSQNKTIVMQPILKTETITVMASKTLLSELDVASNISNINEEDFNHNDDLGDILAKEGGIFVKRYGGGESNKSISMRNLGAEHTLILLDGIPLNKSQTGMVDLDNYYSDSYSDIEIYHGGISTLFGNGAVGGVVNLEQKGSGHEGVEVTLENGSYGSKKILTNLNLNTRTINHMVSFRRSYAKNNYKFLYNNKDGYRRNSDFSKSAINYLARFNPEQNDVLLFNSIYFSDRHGTPRAMISNDSYQGQAKMQEEELILRLKWDRRFTQNTSLKSQVYLRRNWSHYDDPDISLNSDHFNEDGGLILNMNMLLDPSFRIYAGLDAQNSKIRSSEAGNHLREQVSGYALLNWICWQRDKGVVTLNAAARGEYYSDFGSVFIPRGGVHIIFDDWRFFVSLGGNYRAPTMNELYWNPGGEPNLKPERSTSFEGGINYSRDSWAFKISIYYLTLKNMIRWHPTPSGIWRPENLDVVASKGIEIQLKSNLFLKLLEGKINFKYGLATVEKTTQAESQIRGNRLPYLPATEINAHIAAKFKNFKLGLEIDYMTFRYTTIANLDDQFLPSAAVCNLYADYKQQWQWLEVILYARLENIFKEEYQLINNYPVPLQIWKIGIRFGLSNQ